MTNRQNLQSSTLELSQCFQADGDLIDDLGVNFTLFTAAFNFSQAKSACEENNSELAGIDSREKFDFISSFVQNLTESSRYWIGLQVDQSTADDDTLSSTERFQFLNGNTDAEALEFIHVGIGEVPWAVLSKVRPEPNNFKGNEDCVEYAFLN